MNASPKPLLLIFFFLFTFTALTACTAAPENPDASATDTAITVTDTAVTFTDDAGVTHTVNKHPQTTAVLFSSFADIWTTAGGNISVTVGESVERGFAAHGVTLVDDGAGKTVNTELLIAAKPDFVICSADIPAQAECAAGLCEAGIAAAVFRVETFDDYLRVLEIFCALNETPDIYETCGIQIKEQIDGLLSAAAENNTIPEKRILFLRAGTSAKATKAKTADDHFAAVMLEELGCHNIADDAPVLLDGLSIEEIITENPDAVFISMMGEEAAVRSYMDGVLRLDTWQTLDAVRDGRVYYLPKDLFQFKPNARWYEAYRYLYELLYDATP